MRHFEDFKVTGVSFQDRVGAPVESDAAMGLILLNFSYLEDTARNVIVLLTATLPEVGNILAAALSFRQKLDVIGSLVRHRLRGSGEATVAGEVFHELLFLCRRAEELRNSYLHSSYAGPERAKFSAKAKFGLKIHREAVNGGVLLDVADFIAYAGGELEGLPLLLGIADRVSVGSDFVSYTKESKAVATFKFGVVS